MREAKRESNRLWQANRRAANPGIDAPRVADWKRRNRDKVLEQSRRHYRRSSTQVASEKLSRKEKAAGRPRPTFCELCGRRGRIQFDHDHNTGLFRGWLCSPCNRVLGMVREDIQTLKHMIDYLEAGGFGATP